MRLFISAVSGPLLALALCQALPAIAASDAESDALSLESDTSAQVPGARDTKIFVEGALGSTSQRYQLGSRDFGRVSLDFSHTARLAPGWRAVVSDRVDSIHPAAGGLDATVNSLREAYISWQPEGATTLLEFGRINLRYGPAYGYNPTDFFRDGSVRVLTTADPFALRENRLGSVMLRGQRLWDGGSLSVAFSPELDNTPSRRGWGLDLGSTNNRDRVLVALGTQFSQTASSQVLLYKQAGLPPALGANLTALVSDAATVHLEFSRGREPSLLGRALAIPGTSAVRNRFVAGGTYTTVSKLSLTAEYQYNGFGLGRTGRVALAANTPAHLAYLGEALRLQELSSREAYLIYVTQKGVGLKNLDLAAYIRFNSGDNSRLAWLELRHHWPSFDLTFQLQQNMGRSSSEFGVLPERRTLQVLGTYYF